MSEKYTMSLSLNVLNHLGINLYSNIPAVLSEIVANSWDADANQVDITIDKDEIIIEDNGCGMDIYDINNKFLYVGHRKREESLESPKYKRRYMGRKGIGKLSMFSIAQEIDVISRKQKKNGEFEINGFRMDSKKIEAAIRDDNSNMSKSYNPEPIDTTENELNETGTKIILKKLKKNTSTLTETYIKKRVARRFGIIGDEFNFTVRVNGETVTIQDRGYFNKLAYIWYFGEESKKYSDYCNNAVHIESLENIVSCGAKNYRISGWIGSVNSSGDLKEGDDNLNKIIILVRGKLGQEDILGEYSEGGLYSKYLIGEINADFFDDDDMDDMATSNRQEYRHDDERFTALRDFVYNQLKYIEGKWTELRNKTGEQKAVELLPVIDTWICGLKGDDKQYARKMFGKVNQIIADDDKKREILKYSILAFEKFKYTRHLSAIDIIDAKNFEIFKDVFTGLDEIEATLYYQIIKERMEVVKKFQNITEENALEKVVQEHLFNHLWLLDPSWERVENTEYMETIVEKALQHEIDSLTLEEKNARLDLGYRQSAGKHIVIELKRADRIIKTDEVVKQVKKYHDALQKALYELNYKNSAFEILFVVGRPIDNNDSLDNRTIVDNIIKPLNARIVYYQELIQNAFKAYSEYIAANKQAQPLIEIFDKLEQE